MKVDCIIDGKTLSLSLNSNKPLSMILMENIHNESIKSCCNGKLCGKCVVLMEGKAVLSCLVPAFEIRGKNIVTLESFQTTKDYQDIEKAYSIVKARPCPSCFAARTLLIQSLVSMNESDEDDIKKEMEIMGCSCMDTKDIVKIVQVAIEIRRRRRARRS